MRIIPEPILFEWDAGNSDKSLKKHKTTNIEAEEVFKNKPKFIFLDDKHSSIEKRYLIWGITNKIRKLAVIFTIRSSKIRIISARDMNKKERSTYAEKIKIDSTL